METKEAIRILKIHNEWRREKRDVPDVTGHGLKMTDPKILGIAIDRVVNDYLTNDNNKIELSEVLTDFHKFIIESGYNKEIHDSGLVAFKFRGMDYEEQFIIKNK